jgi:hypothetical protein
MVADEAAWNATLICFSRHKIQKKKETPEENLKEQMEEIQAAASMQWGDDEAVEGAEATASRATRGGNVEAGRWGHSGFEQLQQQDQADQARHQQQQRARTQRRGASREQQPPQPQPQPRSPARGTPPLLSIFTLFWGGGTAGA